MEKEGAGLRLWRKLGPGSLCGMAVNRFGSVLRNPPTGGTAGRRLRGGRLHRMDAQLKGWRSR